MAEQNQSFRSPTRNLFESTKMPEYHDRETEPSRFSPGSKVTLKPNRVSTPQPLILSQQRQDHYQYMHSSLLFDDFKLEGMFSSR